MLVVVLKASCRDQGDAMNQHLREGQLDHEDLCPLCLLTSHLESRDEILVSGGEFSQP